jgi:hypothetical protein
VLQPRPRDSARPDRPSPLKAPEAADGSSSQDNRKKLIDLHYAASRHLCQWLDDCGALWPFSRADHDNRTAGPTGSRAFKHAVGAAQADVQAEWVDRPRHR